ncbi:type 1 fimbrial protein [Xenorhabdus entomophaga]|uniref:type 1 fimbrial protein n=1 Tax=Xenorhabdus entomophaga TaxID=3136257 RepID=UPI0030F42F25
MLRKMTTFLFMSLSYPAMAYSPSTSNSGTIHFQGAIVDPPCQFSWDEEHTEMVCWYNGEKITQDKVIEYQKDKKILLSLQKHIGTEEIRWVGEDKKLGIITITYH